jgi:ankyrin repeat protein
MHVIEKDSPLCITPWPWQVGHPVVCGCCYNSVTLTWRLGIEMEEQLLHHSTKQAHHSVTEYLVKSSKANVHVVDNNGQTPLHYACSHMDAQKCWHLDTVKVLVDCGSANVDAVDKAGQTAVHVACQSQNLKVIQYLVEKKGANTEAVDGNGRTALPIACGAGYLDLTVYLVSHFPVDLARTTARTRQAHGHSR